MGRHARPATVVRVPQQVCRDFERASRLEWLETNHTGAYAMGTVAGVNTRRYHSLLIASLNPPVDRLSILPRVEEQVTTANGKRFELATVQYPGAVQPHGSDLLAEFRLDPFPKWRYELGTAEVEKIVCLLDSQQAVVVSYQSTEPCRLTLRLLLSFRDYHSLTHKNQTLRTMVEKGAGLLRFAPYEHLPLLTMFHCARTFIEDGIWYLNHEYLRELDRGLNFREDLFSPGYLIFDVDQEHQAWFIATLEPDRFTAPVHHSQIRVTLAEEAKRRYFHAETAIESTLRRALDQFRVVRSNGSPSLIAGYPWFTDWSRDTLISFPALSIAGFPSGESKKILSMLLEARSQGIIPNRFSDRHSVPEYNTVDATLWLFIAAHYYIEETRDLGFLRDFLYPAASSILEWHYRGTHHGIRVDPADQLLAAGGPETQLTWMDAKIGDTPVTPRSGKPVDVNALWYNALRIAAIWAGILGLHIDRERHEREAQGVLLSFQKHFWNHQNGCLYDVIEASTRDSRIRPNQLFALSLPFPMLDRQRARLVVELVRRKLLTPVGLRTLAPEDPGYQPRFEGGVQQRDGAYHQGTVWPWLIGPFIQAYLYAYNDSQDAVAFCSQLLNRLAEEFTACCLGSLSEVYDAEAPQRPAGCPAQLWSIAQFIIARRQVSRAALY